MPKQEVKSAVCPLQDKADMGILSSIFAPSGHKLSLLCLWVTCLNITNTSYLIFIEVVLHGPWPKHISMSGVTPPRAQGWVPPPKSKWAAASASPQCPTCRLAIYPAEVVIAAHRTPFHKWCVKCKRCKKNLTPATLNEHKLKLYCQNCYQHVFMDKVMSGKDLFSLVSILNRISPTNSQE